LFCWACINDNTFGGLALRTHMNRDQTSGLKPESTKVVNYSFIFQYLFMKPLTTKSQTLLNVFSFFAGRESGLHNSDAQ